MLSAKNLQKIAIWAKKPCFRPPGGQKAVKMNFWEKSENVMFLHSLRLSYMQTSRKLKGRTAQGLICKQTALRTKHDPIEKIVET